MLTDAWGWEQWIIVFITVCALIMHASKNGEPRDGKFNIIAALIAQAFYIFVLWSGGFFS